jgi:transposase
VTQAAFPKGALAIRVRDELPGLFEDEDFASSFGIRGRPGISPGQLALATVLQFAENLTDRQAADAVRGRIDWKYAPGLELDDPGFDFTVLSGFRTRLIEHGLEERVLDALLERLSQRGLLRAGGRQRTDSTHVLAAVCTLHRIEFVGETGALRPGGAGRSSPGLAGSQPNGVGRMASAVWGAGGVVSDAQRRRPARRVGRDDRPGSQRATGANRLLRLPHFGQRAHPRYR